MVSVITCTHRDHMLENIFQNYAHQVMEKKELIIILNNDELNIQKWKAEADNYSQVSVYQMPGWKSVSECKNFAVQKALFNYIAKFDDDDYYAPCYLTSAYQAFKKHGDADIVGKSSVYYYFKKNRHLAFFPSGAENMFTDRVSDSTLVFKKEILNDVRFTPMKVGSDRNFQKDCIRKGFRIFSTDRYNHAVIRDGNPHAHTWKIPDERLLHICMAPVYTRDFKPLVNSGP